MKVVLDKDSERYDLAIQENLRYFRKTQEEEEINSDNFLSQLRMEFERLKINPGYHLSAIGQPDASGANGGLCLHEEDGYWLVYHSERGCRSRPEIFTNIQSAANYFLWTHAAKPSGNNSDVGSLPRI